MDDNFKLILTTGAPGSMWSMISHRFKKSFQEFDFTDETEDRQYSLPEEHKNTNYTMSGDSWKPKTHIGSYFGPFHEFGHHFDNLAYYKNVEDFYAECLKPFSDVNAPYKLIKSHWFAYNLEWIWQNCKGHDLMLIWREPEHSRKWWYSMGGWGIKHPVYDWYDNDDKMWLQIQEEARLIKQFGDSKNVTWYDYDNDNSWIVKQFNQQPTGSYTANAKHSDTVKLAYLKIV